MPDREAEENTISAIGIHGRHKKPNRTGMRTQTNLGVEAVLSPKGCGVGHSPMITKQAKLSTHPAAAAVAAPAVGPTQRSIREGVCLGKYRHVRSGSTGNVVGLATLCGRLTSKPGAQPMARGLFKHSDGNSR